MRPFRIRTPDADLDDLHRRLAATRWPDAPPDAGWDYGTNLEYLRELVDYWRHGYDWRAHEAELNQLPQFLVEVEGLDVHLVYERGSGERPLPLVITHGWPGSFVEFAHLVDVLAHPERHGGRLDDAFDVVLPSIPGFGYSARPKGPGVGPTRVAELWNRLMTGPLGYARYGAQGGDWGAVIASRLGQRFPEHVVGVHLNMIGVRPYTGQGAAPLTPEEKAWLASIRPWRERETAYQLIQSTKPQTLAYGLMDSPVGLAAWIIEKFHGWSDCEGDIESRFTKDQLLTNAMIYWLTRSINSANRLYFEARREGWWALGPGESVAVPTGIAAFPVELTGKPPRSWAERAYHVVRWTDMPSGGHFAALEEGTRLVEDVRAFFRPLRPRAGVGRRP